MASFSAIWAARSLFRYADFSLDSSSRNSMLNQRETETGHYNCHRFPSPLPPGSPALPDALTQVTNISPVGFRCPSPQVNQISPVLFDVLPHFLVSELLVADACKLFSHPFLLLQQLVPHEPILLCLKVKGQQNHFFTLHSNTSPLQLQKTNCSAPLRPKDSFSSRFCSALQYIGEIKQ